MPRVVFEEESKTGLSFEIRQPHRKCQRKPTLQSLANPAVSIKMQEQLLVPCLLCNVAITLNGQELIYLPNV